ncbi:MAG: hypothetical protein ACREQV_11805 [Candidatus Binatia bacterium]
MTKDMTLKCRKANGQQDFGGPPTNLYTGKDAWITDAVCSNNVDFIANTIFHESLHACGTPGDNPQLGYTATTSYDIANECSPWAP